MSVFAVLMIASALRYDSPGGARATGHLAQAAYVWQRAWSPAVVAGVEQTSALMGPFIVLAAEVEWRRERMQVVRVPVDWGALQRMGAPVGVCLRIGGFSGSFEPEAEPARSLATLAARILADAQARGVTPTELQVDFDCPESKLDGYRKWLTKFRETMPAAHLTITALPCWLKRREFASLAAATDGFVLQVHSLERPRLGHQIKLCDPQSARMAVEKAARLGKPFFVALPTYGYWAAFDASGALVGLEAEGPSATWPADTRIQRIEADPQEMAALVRGWIHDRPTQLRGVIWYRLPVSGDRRNWSWRTLQTVMAGCTSQDCIEAMVRRDGAGLFDLELRNTGSAPGPRPQRIAVSWRGARVRAHDVLTGYASEAVDGQHMDFELMPGGDLEVMLPGEHQRIAWLRLDRDTEVVVDVTKADGERSGSDSRGSQPDQDRFAGVRTVFSQPADDGR